MRLNPFIFGALFCALCVATLPAPASAGGLFGGGCGPCSGYAPGQVFYAAPTYSYAPPTVTVVPHYIVQPNIIVRRTYVVRPTRYVDEVAPCSPCGGGGFVVNQGQYSDAPAFYPGVAIGFGAYGRHHYRHRHYSPYRYRHAHW
jgi:hypothetical protein